MALSKCDLADQWEIDEASLAGLRALGCPWVRTSAKTGEGVEDTFVTLAREMIGHD